MTSEEHDEMQRLEGLVKRYRSRIVELKVKNAALRAAPASAPPELPPSLQASIDLFREDPSLWHAEWQRKHEFKAGLIEKVRQLEAGSGAGVSARVLEWQPIETAPRNQRCFFWVVPKSADEAFVNTSGDPINAVGKKPHRIEGQWGWWGSLWKPEFWMSLPSPPVRAALGVSPAAQKD